MPFFCLLGQYKRQPVFRRIISRNRPAHASYGTNRAVQAQFQKKVRIFPVAQGRQEAAGSKVSLSIKHTHDQVHGLPGQQHPIRGIFPEFKRPFNGKTAICPKGVVPRGCLLPGIGKVEPRPPLRSYYRSGHSFQMLRFPIII